MFRRAQSCAGFPTVPLGNFRGDPHIASCRSGGKGGASVTHTAVNYTYFASFAIALGEGLAEDMLRIWADGKLLFDKTGTNPDVARQSLRYRFYPGSESQLTDPLADFGNRIPNITAEITYRRTVHQARTKGRRPACGSAPASPFCGT